MAESVTPERLRAQADADLELADIKQREVDRLRTNAIRLRGEANHLGTRVPRGEIISLDFTLWCDYLSAYGQK